MRRILLFSCIIIFSFRLHAQSVSMEKFIRDSSMAYGQVSFALRDADSGRIIYSVNPEKSLTQASVMKLVTSSAAIEMLGPDHKFTTLVGYTGKIAAGKVLNGNIIIRGGGDPSLGSEKFADQYGDVIGKWAESIKSLGIKKIKGRVIADDSYFDYRPVPPNWIWEDMGNYYGSGAYGLSISDNTIKLHYSTGAEGSKPVLLSIEPGLAGVTFADSLKASGDSDEGYIYSEPYGNHALITGTIPVNNSDFVLKASIPDPPLTAARLLNSKLAELGISTEYEPVSARILSVSGDEKTVNVCTTVSPRLADLIVVLNYESVNLYAEHLLKELGREFGGRGTTADGVKVIRHFLDSIGVKTAGLFIEDGSGLSPQDGINSSALSDLLFRMKKSGKYFSFFYNSLPEPGKSGTLKNYFRDPVFESSMRAKSGSLLRVRSYAGYLKGRSGKEMVFSIIVNNYTGPSSAVIRHIEEILKESIVNN